MPQRAEDRTLARENQEETRLVLKGYLSVVHPHPEDQDGKWSATWDLWQVPKPRRYHRAILADYRLFREQTSRPIAYDFLQRIGELGGKIRCLSLYVATDF